MKNDNFQAQSATIRVQLGSWSDLRDQACAIRFEVFVEEQQVPIAEELDAMDAACLHALAFSQQGEAIATGRLLPDGHIGRMAVRLSERKKGVGAAVLKALIEAAETRGFKEVLLGAQLHARGFYLKQGFVEFGDVFLDANIEHVMMRKELT
ncbi:MAG: GNAT family N-acetyltransferase [Burkholderiaceae bacterium]|nr:GNAT family N-acetyltransferase [Burkholderiaceae bacterium]